MELQDYLALVTSQHAQRPKFLAVLSAILAPLIAAEAAALSLPAAFDLDTAVGVQLDAVGAWIGRTRVVTTPLPSVFFSFGISGLGFGEGVWKGPYDATDGRTILDDDSYRFLLRGKIAANTWDGTLSGAAAAMTFAFEGQTGSLLIVQDNQDMTMSVGVAGAIPDVVITSLLTAGYIPVKPEGVGITYYVTSVNGAPLFGFGVQNQYVSGFGAGAWGTRTAAA